MIKKIEKLWKSVVEFINWPYAVGGRQAIVEKKLFNIASMLPLNVKEEMFFKDSCGVRHSLSFECDEFLMDFESVSIYVTHCIYMCNKKIKIEIFRIFKTGRFEIEKLKQYSIIFSDYEKYENYNLFYYNSVIDYDALIRQLDLLRTKLL